MTTAIAHSKRRRSTRLLADSQSADSFTIRLLPLLAAVLSLPLIAAGACMLLAGIASYQAQAFLDDWTNKRSEPTAKAWQIAHDAAQRAVRLYPGNNGEYLERLGRVWQWQQFRAPFGAAQAQASRRAALEAFRASTQARPEWPYAWAALAYAKLHLLELDNEFAHALQQANNLGPNRIEINRTLAEIGLLAWPSLDAGQRSATLAAADRVVQYSGNEARYLSEVAAHAGMSEALCEHLDERIRKKQGICQ
ncbi:hypothetical protein [Pseudomonas oryzae]|uniref:Uncharacterized protein n=1 Tax=Pseudomonas oryzae TaxID=1392877 RepID=A0A1H1M6X1_9PSED|nr:hypothetical protein [Pseudomonas oryzae]SDR82528.1 hypothetical protein SAMN05216221_0428 [Pseudomonas oryzae]